jgi:hypothetical protein
LASGECRQGLLQSVLIAMELARFAAITNITHSDRHKPSWYHVLVLTETRSIHSLSWCSAAFACHVAPAVRRRSSSFRVGRRLLRT